MKLFKQLWQYIKDRLHTFSQYLAYNHDRRLVLDRAEYLKSVTEDAIRMFNFVEKEGFHYGTIGGVTITLQRDADTLLDRISELRNVYVESKMKEYDNGKNS